MSGMMGRPLAEDLAVVNNTLSTWSLSPNLGSAYAPLILNVPLLNITHNVPVSIAQHGLSTSRKLGIAFGSIITVGFVTGLLVLLYLILHHRLRSRSRTRSWKRHLDLRKLYLDRKSHCKRNNNNNNNHNNNVSNNINGPVTMVGSEDSLGGGVGGDTLTDPDPFAAFAVDFTIPPLEEMSNFTITAK